MPSLFLQIFDGLSGFSFASSGQVDLCAVQKQDLSKKGIVKSEPKQTGDSRTLTDSFPHPVLPPKIFRKNEMSTPRMENKLTGDNDDFACQIRHIVDGPFRFRREHLGGERPHVTHGGHGRKRERRVLLTIREPL